MNLEFNKYDTSEYVNIVPSSNCDRHPIRAYLIGVGLVRVGDTYSRVVYWWCSRWTTVWSGQFTANGESKDYV